jgi:hypothetical protein
MLAVRGGSLSDGHGVGAGSLELLLIPLETPSPIRFLDEEVKLLDGRHEHLGMCP